MVMELVVVVGEAGREGRRRVFKGACSVVVDCGIPCYNMSFVVEHA